MDAPMLAPGSGYRPISSQDEWSTGLFECASDVPTCCLTCWCPWITFGQNAEIIDRGISSCGSSGALYGLIAFVTGCQWIYACTYRTKLKRQYGMPENWEHRELEHRGFDVPVGWYGNMEKLNVEGGAPIPPMVPGGMKR